LSFFKLAQNDCATGIAGTKVILDQDDIEVTRLIAPGKIKLHNYYNILINLDEIILIMIRIILNGRLNQLYRHFKYMK
jgi:hypothetical protein